LPAALEVSAGADWEEEVRKRVSAVILMPLLAIVVYAGSADARATGNRQAIAVARAVLRAYQKVPAVTFVRTGNLLINDFLNPGGTGRLDVRATRGYVPRGWVHAVEYGFVALSHDRVAWADLRIVPRCAPNRCRDVPARIVIERGVEFAALGSPVRSCYAKTRPTLFRTGEAWVAVAGRYEPPVRRGGAVVLTQQGLYTGTRTYIDIATYSTRTHLEKSSIVRVSPGGGRKRAFTIHNVFGYPTRVPPAPRITNVC
jgi:hypothetical protein